MAAGYAYVPGEGWVRLSGSDLMLGTGHEQAARGDHTHAPTGLPDTDWIAFPFVNGFTNYGSTWETMMYRRLGGVVHVEGFGEGGARTSGTVIGTLPVGFRPRGDKHYPIGQDTIGDPRVNIYQDGRIAVNKMGSGWFTLELHYVAYQ
jgi:hypothetical protein